jgi:hypothetical protein
VEIRLTVFADSVINATFLAVVAIVVAEFQYARLLLRVMYVVVVNLPVVGCVGLTWIHLYPQYALYVVTCFYAKYVYNPELVLCFSLKLRMPQKSVQ